LGAQGVCLFVVVVCLLLLFFVVVVDDVVARATDVLTVHVQDR
jgi:hypothetical protein